MALVDDGTLGPAEGTVPCSLPLEDSDEDITAGRRPLVDDVFSGIGLDEEAELVINILR